MKIRDELIVRIVEDGLLVNGVITNYRIMRLSHMCSGGRYDHMDCIYVLPDSIMRNWRALGDEYVNQEIRLPEHFGKVLPYQFNHSSKTDYHLSKGFIEWLNMEYKKIKGGK